jgi:hypothetical protein
MSMAASSSGPSISLLKTRLAKSLAGSKNKDVKIASKKEGSAAPAPASPASVTTFGSLGLDSDLTAALEAQGKTYVTLP